MRGRAAGHERNAAQPGVVDVDELRGREIARHQDRARGDFDALLRAAGKFAQHLALEIGQIGDALGEARIAGGLERRGAARASWRATRMPALLPARMAARAAASNCGSSSNSRCAAMMSRTAGLAPCARCSMRARTAASARSSAALSVPASAPRLQ